ncbi:MULTISPECIES: ornithine carbamoyltransferase [Campylobacter]|uniref:Ornithine carbamoyltransferase n=1 Tax=Campylobacter curvus (strain 525.92) TaxID=360105 RepID=OTC_CAMC5|nr:MULTISPECIES: ornithine carbamoyltransferase [Campylobacter]A7GZL8.1 RecName: Full=Ornithine carbamoyltransferase; Short=OTCase [Campylobacter curvus 525.92]EAU01327.1 ornithine carbamoyltransferase [Campylobacter curvus 525.92]EJP75143.1 ornithine carbamoyltransferase [Campylobacter sp. FOBRC14]
MRHFLTLDDFSKDEILQMINLAGKIKKEAKVREFKPYLKDQTLAMIFEKSSTRTRVSFEVGMYQLGGHALFLSANDLQIGRGEPIKDTARVISSMCDMAMLRVNRHETLEEFAKFSQNPVINGLSDKFHPVQLMADYLTMRERGSGEKIAYIGDGNNMAHSWLMLASKLGLELRIATPKGYEPDAKILEKAQQNAKISGAKIYLSNEPKEAVSGADVVTTDTWVSMGQEAQKEKRLREFAGFCVDENLMSLAAKNAIFLHCLPAYRGYEVSEAVFEAHADEIFAEAQNRLHAQKGVMVWLNDKR